MKKAISVFLVLCAAAALCLSGCGGEKAQPAAQEPDISLQAVMDEILANVEMPEMMPLTADDLLDYFGLDAQTIADSAVCVNANGYEKEEIVLLRAADAGSTQAIVEKLEAHLQDSKVQMQDYLPAQYEMLQKCAVRSSGTYVWLFASDANDAMQSILDNYLQ